MAWSQFSANFIEGERSEGEFSQLPGERGKKSGAENMQNKRRKKKGKLGIVIIRLLDKKSATSLITV